MLKNIHKIVLAMALTTATSLGAQEAATGAEALSTGEDLTKTAPEVTSEEMGDWTVRCQETDAGEQCQMYQLLRDATDNPVVEVNLFNVKNGGQVFAGGSIVVPLETLLTAQLTVSVDDDVSKRYPFAFCTPTGCVARIGLTAEDVASYKKGAKATVSIVPVAAPDKTVSVDMSLTGFTAAMDRISKE